MLALDEPRHVEINRAGTCVDEKSALAHQTCALSSRTEVESIGARLDINLHDQTKVETITEALGNDQTPCGIDGSSHTKLVFFLW